MTADRGRPTLGVAALIGLGTLNVGTLVIGLGIGWWIDHQLGSFPVGVLVGLAVGIGAGLAASWVQVRRYFGNNGFDDSFGDDGLHKTGSSDS